MAQFFFGPSECARRQLFPGVAARLIWGQRLMLSLVEFEPGAVVQRHNHPNEQIGTVIEGEAEFVVGGQRRLLRAGDMYVIPAGVEHEVRAVGGRVRALDAFHPPREEYKGQAAQ